MSGICADGEVLYAIFSNKQGGEIERPLNAKSVSDADDEIGKWADMPGIFRGYIAHPPKAESR